MAVPRAEGGVLLNMYIHLRGEIVKQEKLCETEDMTFEDEWDKDGNRVKFMPGNKELEELGAENESIRRQLRDAEILSSFPTGLKPRVKAANSMQVGGDHYKKMDVQPWDVIDHGPRQQAIGFYRYNGLKYIMRAGEKGDFKEDIQKAHHYLQKLLELL